MINELTDRGRFTPCPLPRLTIKGKLLLQQCTKPTSLEGEAVVQIKIQNGILIPKDSNVLVKIWDSDSYYKNYGFRIRIRIMICDSSIPYYANHNNISPKAKLANA